MSNTYCTASQVLDGPLRGIDLSQLGDTAAQAGFVAALLPATKRILENTVGRDFVLHVDDVVAMDGPDADTLTVWKDDRTLCAPIVSVSQLKIWDEIQSLNGLKIGAQEGTLGYQLIPRDRIWLECGRRGSYWRFPADFRNIEVTLTWGYSDAPEDVQLAQAYVTAAYVMSTVSGGRIQQPVVRQIEDFREEWTGIAPALRAQVSMWSTLALTLLDPYRTGRRSY